MTGIFEKRNKQIHRKGSRPFEMACEKQSLAGAVSQRACAFCGSRVVLYPIADALHLIHGPVGCAAYTWDIRGSLSSGPELHRMSFTTDLREKDVIHGGENKLYLCLKELIARYQPKAAFVYSTCIAGVIGDDVGAVCKRVSRETGLSVIAVASEGFGGTKKDGYRAACTALKQLVGTGDISEVGPLSLNILGDFNIAGEVWTICQYYRQMGLEVVSSITGDGRVDDIRRAHGAKLNVVQCSGSMVHLARHMQEQYGIPYIHVSYFGIQDMSRALYETAEFFKDAEVMERTRDLVRFEMENIMPELTRYRGDLQGKKAGVYTGGAFKAFSLIESLRLLGMTTAFVGSQTGGPDDYKQLEECCDEGTIIVDDANVMELVRFARQTNIDLFIGGVKERPVAYKLGIGFCDHNHERKLPLAGFEGMLNFAREVHSSVMSPVWQFIDGRKEQMRTPHD
jgi:nitrogenase molybdenum-cofactor synthesis protein NifE